MAKDLEELVLAISADNRQMLRVLKRLEGDTSKTTRAVERRFEAMSKKIDGRLEGIGKNAFRGLLAGVTGALGTRELARLTDTWTDLNSRARLAAGGQDAGAAAMERLTEVARRTYSALDLTVESWLANSTAMKELGYSTDQQLDYTEALNNALVISAAKGQRAESVQNALAKAMALGTLQGDNLNTVIEQGGRVAEALAAGLGVGVNQLRTLGKQGQITGRDIVRALSSQMKTLREEAEAMPATIADGVQLLQNALLEYVGKGDEAVGISARISEALVLMADNFDQTADVALQVAGVIAGVLVGRSLAMMIAKLGLGTAALTSFVRALVAARSAAGLATAMAGVSAAAGPVGMVIGGAVVASLLLFTETSAAAGDGAGRFADRLSAMGKTAEESADKVEAASRRFSEATKNALSNEVAAATAELDAARDAASSLLDQIAQNAAARLVTEEQRQQLIDLAEGLRKGEVAADEAKDELFAFANSNPNFQRLADQMQPLLDRLALVVAGARQAQAELAAVSGQSDGANFSRGDRVRAAQSLKASREESAAYEAEAMRRARLGRAQLSLENEIARVKKQAADDGAKLSEDQIRRIAEANLAGNAARTASGRGGGRGAKEKADDYERLAKRVAEATEAQRAEIEAMRGVNPLIEDYGYAVDKARMAHELLTAAKEAGRAVTPELSAAIDNLAHNYAQASAEAQKLAEEQGKVRQKAEEFKALQKDVASGFIKDLRNGVTAADAFANALDKVIDRLIEMALTDLFGGGGGFSLLSLFGMKDGGTVQKKADGGTVRGPGGPRGDKIPVMLSDGEHVTRTAMAKKHARLLALINADALPAMKDGGFAGRAPAMPDIRAMMPPPVRMVQPAREGTGKVQIMIGLNSDSKLNIMPDVEAVAEGKAMIATSALSNQIEGRVDGRNDAVRTRGMRP